ncbi:P-loop containing nucleoside triphosphate hydrolase protein [Pseudomassariella vexata]|uniref:p-loop containing nucleoside triphosphate hydrolase protein n=1 Tax=Pseudomassariella vexata TaxID=1141098 RepID=A0A1Y2EA03_9PEZI|nr:P-loop containing nucleoside triphosphate hydrolase protein [Pseudomassariella vexata]ORY68401.1 P-loop containing nucleoside triphosphate hydrolase protein [Pseudomassariella vexata]
MRLLKRSPNGDIKLISVKNDDDRPPYATLSHTWTNSQEVTYNELVAGAGKDKTGYAKIRFCMDRDAQDGIEYCWVDTCCIDRSIQQELQTAINSMFRWYQAAKKCYAYLLDAQVPKEVSDAQAFPISWMESFRRSRWFTHGWTLQELLALASVEFFSEEGKLLGTRISLEQDFQKITKLPVEVLRGKRLSDFDSDEQIGWTANRTTSLREDKIYCLLGICGVFLPLIYGEGEVYAETRLREEIQRRKEGWGMERLRDRAVSSPLPFARNEIFTGREDELQSLKQFLLPPYTHQRMTIYGLGGCGKSALAIEFAYRALAQQAGRLVFWVPAISRESFELAYRDIGISLRLPGITDDNADIKELVKDALGNSRRAWFMIVDNADDPEALMNRVGGDPGTARLVDWLPKSDGGKIVFTTRSRKAARDLTQSNALELRDMGKIEARQLLRQRIAKQALLSDTKAVGELLELLAYLPLAIIQAAAFIDSNDIAVNACRNFRL